MAAHREILRAVRDYQRPLHDPNKTYTIDRKLIIEGVTLTVKSTTLIIREDDAAGREDLQSTLSIFERSTP